MFEADRRPAGAEQESGVGRVFWPNRESGRLGTDHVQAAKALRGALAGGLTSCLVFDCFT